MSTRAALERALDDLNAGRLPDDAGRRLLVLGGRAFLATPSRARDALLRQEGIRERDRLLIELARDYCGDLQGVKPKADRIATWARRYEGTSWPRDRHATTRPERLKGQPEGLIWQALKTHPDLPRNRRLREILAGSGL